MGHRQQDVTANAPPAGPTCPSLPRPRRRRGAAALALALALLAVAPLALASDEGERDARWSEEPRTVAAWPTGSGFALRSERASGLADDEMSATYDAQAARLDVGLSASAPEDAEAGLALVLHGVTEYRDLDGDGRLGPADEVVRRVAVAGTPAVGSAEGLPGGGWRATSVHTLSPANLAAGPTRLEVAVEARPDATDGRAPTRLDVAVRLLDGWARNGTHLALEAGLDSDSVPAGVGADSARVGDGPLDLALAWQDGRGTVTEAVAPRTATFVRSQPAGNDVTFPAAVSAAWRPTAEPGGGAAGSVAFYLGAAAVAAAAVAVPAWRRLRPA